MMEKEFSYLITFCIGTHERPEECVDTVDKIHDKYPGAQILVADDSKQQTVMATDCKDPVQVQVYHLEHDIGVAAKRNWLAQNAMTDFIVMMDDDNKVTSAFDLRLMLNLLQAEPGLAVVGCRKMDQGRNRWSNAEGDFRITKDVLYVDRPVRHAGMVDDHTWMLVDMVPMMFLGRREIVRNVGFDYRFKTCGEHMDFFLRLAFANGHRRIRRRFSNVMQDSVPEMMSPLATTLTLFQGMAGVGFVPACYFIDTASRPVQYKKQRKRGSKYRRKMLAMWHFKDVANWNSNVKNKAIYAS